ncbi:acetoacetate decarboxylase family protein [Nostoc sp. NMS4]|uniref:acetoacetate decarboxylase family protein n=1 Tax=Nostoc sp. NMS4 TaxID=2815390 RepID=UPI0025D1800E|nr:acetoacetate decarboxylase family protein [Nostoc sp. NMS4]MBN3922529.1 acetoacetate decarboxylase family protein [Nostoc sp. NMS4]
MQNTDFFQQIKQVEIPWGSTKIFLPVFYYDVATLSVQFLASIKKVSQFLPSRRMHPFRVTPWHCVVSISAFEYRDSDIGAYNEVSIAVPVILDGSSPLFIGTRHKVPQVYIHHLPVTTEIARDLGVEFAGYPKFLANIDFERDGKWVRCHLKQANQSIFTLTAQEGTLQNVPRSRMQPITVRSGYLLRCELIVSERQQMSHQGASGVSLELGEHSIAEELKQWKLGKIIGYQYAPQHQAILTPVIESFSVVRD